MADVPHTAGPGDAELDMELRLNAIFAAFWKKLEARMRPQAPEVILQQGSHGADKRGVRTPDPRYMPANKCRLQRTARRPNTRSLAKSSSGPGLIPKTAQVLRKHRPKQPALAANNRHEIGQGKPRPERAVGQQGRSLYKMTALKRQSQSRSEAPSAMGLTRGRIWQGDIDDDPHKIHHASTTLRASGVG
ncbi:Hypothetical predicted protein [Pelobates cultripes]|uniref:Uncharacterized protein n=1 Tax=Pelobates cultripes TaxID=61616 RepID=A0AAD1WL70_PELCU|nr:Hypothetical predicted protein [Pelobates cultripes]